jgi:hypothetical protein
VNLRDGTILDDRLIVGAYCWASVFASFDLDTRVYLSIGHDARMRASFEISYSRVMAFHPSGFGALNLAGGLIIRLENKSPARARRTRTKDRR